jgi:hypothetical protein
MNGVNISVLLGDNLLQAQGLARFTVLSTGKNYLIYSFNEKSPQNGIDYNRVYVSETGVEGTRFVDITQDEWDFIKSEVMSNICKEDGVIPASIQFNKLEPIQYVVGNYKKIALTDEYINFMIENQKKNEIDENMVTPKTTTQFFDQSVLQPVETVVVESTDEPAIPNAFGMSVPQEDAAPTALVEEPSVSNEVVIRNEELNPGAIRQEVINSLIKVINYCDGDMNKFNELLNGAGALTEDTTIVETPKTVEQVVEEEFPQPQTSIIDINNIPVVNQEPVAEDNVLHEESFEPTVPSVPVDTMAASMTTPVVEEQPQEIIQEVEMPQMVEPKVEIAQEVIEQPTLIQPVEQIAQEVIEQPTVIQSVEPVQNTIVDEPTTELQTITQPVESFEQPTLIQPVEPVIQEQPVQQEVQPVIQNEVQPEMIVQPTIIQPIEQPVETVQSIIQEPISTPNTLGGPTIIGVEDEPQQDMSFINAGPVVMPSGQENVQAQGLPGDNGAKILEKVA